jgi:ribonuclease BN (tRNA processing enzyme)
VVGVWGDEGLIEAAFELEEYDTDSRLEVGPLRLRFATVPHYILTHAVEVSSVETGGRLVFSADCSPNDELVEFARDADLLLIEATLPRPERTGVRGHLTPAEAAEHARRAGARHVVLTHISDELDPDWAREQGSEGFGAPVDVACSGASYEL